MMVNVFTTIHTYAKNALRVDATVTQGLPEVRLMYGDPGENVSIYLSAQEAVDYANRILALATPMIGDKA